MSEEDDKLYLFREGEGKWTSATPTKEDFKGHSSSKNHFFASTPDDGFRSFPPVDLDSSFLSSLADNDNSTSPNSTVNGAFGNSSSSSWSQNVDSSYSSNALGLDEISALLDSYSIANESVDKQVSNYISEATIGANGNLFSPNSPLHHPQQQQQQHDNNWNSPTKYKLAAAAAAAAAGRNNGINGNNNDFGNNGMMGMNSMNSSAQFLEDSNNTQERLLKSIQEQYLEALLNIRSLNGNSTSNISAEDIPKANLLALLQTQLLSNSLKNIPQQLQPQQQHHHHFQQQQQFRNQGLNSNNIFSPNGQQHQYQPLTTNKETNLDRAARFHRESASISEAKLIWSGELPVSKHKNPTYSCKLFLGGLPWDITDAALIQAFKPFGNITIEWPGRQGAPQPKGFTYIIMENEHQVKALLDNSTKDFSKGGSWYYKISSKRMKWKEVELIPWALCDSNYFFSPSFKLEGKQSIFVGALHGMLNAHGLGKIMNELFDGVVYAGIDTDRNKYPIGSGRVTFDNLKSYQKAVLAGFVEIKTSKFTKKFQLDPYLEDSVCSNCGLQQGPYFCRNCFVYYCKTCFLHLHNGEEYQSHRPLVRNTNRTQGSRSSVMPASFHGHHFNYQGCFSKRN